MAGFFSLFGPYWTVLDFLMVPRGDSNVNGKALVKLTFAKSFFSRTVKCTVTCVPLGRVLTRGELDCYSRPGARLHIGRCHKFDPCTAQPAICMGDHCCCNLAATNRARKRCVSSLHGFGRQAQSHAR